MNRFLILILCIQSCSFALAASEKEAVDNDKSSLVNYSVGYQIGQDFKYQEIEIKPEILIQGIEDALIGNKAKLSQTEMKQTMAALGKRLNEIKKKNRDAILSKLREENEAFLSTYDKGENVVKTESGLRYRVVKRGSGESPKLTDTVIVNYRGQLIDGKEFDSSYSRGQPASFRVNAVIKGWTEALTMMKPGDKWEVALPSDLAYGDKGAGKSIPPYSTLLFDIELLKINK